MRSRMTALWASYGLLLVGAVIFSWQANNALERIEDEACVSAIGPILNLDADEIQRYADNNRTEDLIRIIELVEERCEVILGVPFQFAPLDEFCDKPRNGC